MVMNIHNLSPEEALLKDDLAKYKQGINFFYLQQLVPLNLNIYYVEQIIQFPFSLFVEAEKRTFFTVIVNNLIEVGLLIITRVTTTGTRGNTYSLLRFKNDVRKMLKSEYVSLFDQEMSSVRFEAEIKELFEQAKNLRNERIAHIDPSNIWNELEISPVNFPDLKRLRDALNSLLNALSFNTEYMMLPIQYHPQVNQPIGRKYTSDLEDILDSVIRNSDILNMPEKHPIRWSRRKKRLSKEDLNLLNEYRAKFDLPELDTNS